MHQEEWQGFVPMLEAAKRKVIFFWLTHSYLRRIGKRYPEYFEHWMKDLTDNRNSIKVMKLRYIDNLKFEVIAIDMGVDVRYIFTLHKKVLEKIIGY